ncbi:MAG: metal ABC transporter ATP-binding protein [Elusimicrobia bacterium]|nr:metal ABC transporter ATP-binding protein [Elusimicrobiota bacterium]
MDEILRFDNVSLGYGRGKVLSKVSCKVFPGEIVGLVGPNGSGKTTFLKAALGILRPKSGTVWTDLTHGLAYVPQAEEINPYLPLTIEETVNLINRSRHFMGRLTREEKKSAKEAMQSSGILPLADRLLGEVSGGQRQRAILAQAIAQRPKVLLMDEPTKGLDVAAERELIGLITHLKIKDNLTLLLATHNLALPLNFADKVFLFHQGALIVSNPKELVKTKKLEEIYGIPFVNHDAHGLMWIAPARNL